MVRHFFIVLEGVDGCGKTTVSSELARMFDATLVKTPLPDQECLRHIYDYGKDMTARYLFYLSCVMTASQHINKILQVSSVVCDRYLYSAICYHKAMGVDTDIVDIGRLGIIVPDLTFCLITDTDVRRSRLAMRKPEECEKAAADKNNFLDIVQLDLASYADHLIDTTYTSIEEAAAMIASYKI